MCLHLFTKNTPYRSANPIKDFSSFTRNYATTTQADTIVDPIQSMANMTEEFNNTTSEVQAEEESVEEPAVEN